MATRPEKLEFQSDGGKTADRGYAAVRLGVMPSMSEDDRTPNMPKGVLVDGVSAETSAADAGITQIRSFDDLVPLLFAHTVYKSYPASFVEQGRWDRMLTWLQTLSAVNVRNTDISGVKDVDDWLDRLDAAGHHMLCSSGTTGKCSFLLHTEADQALKLRHKSAQLRPIRARGAKSESQ